MIKQLKSKSEVKIQDFNEIVDSGFKSYLQTIADDQYKTLWTYAVNCILGLWLLTSPFIFNYQSTALETSDMACGLMIIFFELLSFSPKRHFMRLGTVAVAFWLFFAPLLFWAPAPAIYLLDTIVACLVIAFCLLVPGTPGQGGIRKPGPDVPPGWSYNPSSWIRRWLGIALALFGFFIARYLAAHQLGYLPHCYDPFFGNGSDQVLHSKISRSFPISDAGFGGVAYALEVLAGFMGDRARWRTSPWVVATFAVLVVPLGVTSIVLVVLQPIAVGAWCGFCLLAAAGLLLSVPLAVHEIIAMGQFMLAAKAKGKDLWKIFWMGGSIFGAGAEDPYRRHYSLGQRWQASVQGVTVPWAIAAQFAIGAWLMVSPALLPLSEMAADFSHLAGALVVTTAAVAAAEVTRSARFLNFAFGLVIVSVGLLFERNLTLVCLTEVIAGLVLCLLSLPKGKIVERYDGWNKFIS